LERKHRPYHRV